MIRTLLDNEPYRHEPGCGDHPQYNRFVEFTTWRALLIDYMDHEHTEAGKNFLKNFIRERSAGIMGDIFAQKEANKDELVFSNPYSEWEFRPNYTQIIEDLRALIAGAMN
jgi:ubiquitin-conjugating enzyme E2 Z